MRPKSLAQAILFAFIIVHLDAPCGVCVHTSRSTLNAESFDRSTELRQHDAQIPSGDHHDSGLHDQHEAMGQVGHRSLLRTSSPSTSSSRTTGQPKASPAKQSPRRSPPKSPLKSPPKSSPPKSPLKSPPKSSPPKSPLKSPPKSSPRKSPLKSPPKSSPPKSPLKSPTKSPPKQSPPKTTPKQSPPAQSVKRSPPKTSPKRSPPAASPKRSPPAASPKRSPPKQSPKRSPPAASPKRSPPKASPALRSPPAQVPIRSPPKATPARSPPQLQTIRPANFVVSRPRTPLPANKPALTCQPSEPFYQGMNIPYENFSVPLNMLMYGNNFGFDSRTTQNYNATFWETVFKDLSAAKGTVARVWLFGDGRGPDIWRGINPVLLGMTEKLVRDLDDMFARAQKYGIKLMPVLFSWGLMGYKPATTHTRWPATVPRNRSILVTDYSITQQFMDNVLRPLVERYDGHPALHSWDCFNEPEQVTVGSATKGPSHINASVADFQHWAALCAATVHMHSRSKATVGAWDVLFLCNNASKGCYGNRWSDENLTTQGVPNRRDLWPYVYLDYYQAHFYRLVEYPIDRPACQWGIDKPLLVGETVNRTAQWGIEFGPTRVMEYSCRNQYQGVLFMGMATHQEGDTSKVPPRMWRDFQVTLNNFDVSTCKSTLPWPDSGDNPPPGYTRDQGMTRSVRAVYFPNLSTSTTTPSTPAANTSATNPNTTVTPNTTVVSTPP